MEKEYFEDFTVGEKILSPGRTITETDIVMWASLTGDWHPIHTNKEYASKTPFGERIAHGMLVLGIGSVLGVRLGQYAMMPKSFIAFYGMESIRFVNPVRIGDTIHLEAEVMEMQEKDDKRGILTHKNTIKNHRGEDCCIYISKSLCGRVPS